MSLTLCQVGACRGEELQDAEIVDYVPGWYVAEYRARCSDCGGAHPLRDCWLDPRDRIHCAGCLDAAANGTRRLDGINRLGMLPLGRDGDQRTARARLQQCHTCDVWFGGHPSATYCGEPCRQRGERR